MSNTNSDKNFAVAEEKIEAEKHSGNIQGVEFEKTSSINTDKEKCLGSSVPDLEKLAVEDEEEQNKHEKDDSEQSNKNEANLLDDFVDEEELKLEEEKVQRSPEEIKERLESAKNFKNTGNEEFNEKKYRESILSYTRGLLICPLCEKILRSILYGNRGAAKMKMGLKDLAVMDCTKSLEYNPEYMKALIRRAALYEELDKLDEALADYQNILKLDPSYRDAIIATRRLPPLIEERNEKLKTEMFGKMKELGNMILRPFGLSTENFQLQQQPEGGYSVNFKK